MSPKKQSLKSIFSLSFSNKSVYILEVPKVPQKKPVFQDKHTLIIIESMDSPREKKSQQNNERQRRKKPTNDQPTRRAHLQCLRVPRHLLSPTDVDDGCWMTDTSVVFFQKILNGRIGTKHKNKQSFVNFQRTVHPTLYVLFLVKRTSLDL